MTTKRKENLYVDGAIIEGLYNLYDIKGKAIDSAVDGYMALRNRGIALLKQSGLTKKELAAMIDLYNGTIIERKYSFNPYVVIQVEDGELYESACTRHGTDSTELVRKIEAMSELAVFFLVDEINRFWNVAGSFGRPTPILDLFLDKYAVDAD